MFWTQEYKNFSINIVDIIDTMISPSDESTEANFVREGLKNKKKCETRAFGWS